MEMISSARAIARIRRRRVQWDCLVVAPHFAELQSIELSNGIRILPTHNLNMADQVEDATIFVPPIWGNPDAVIDKNSALINWLKEKHQQGNPIVATGTGVCLLASAGILDGKVATTHWYYFDEFERRYPKVNLQRQHFITQDGSITCTGSINALVDLTLYYIENEFDKEVSQIIEQHYSHEINRTYDKPWFATGASRHPDEGIIEVQQWMQTHYYQNFDLKALSEMANMSRRNFSRRFKSAVGKSVLSYGIDLKVQAAKELLKDTNLTHQDIADQLGYRDNAYFSRQFKQKIKLTPGEYREMVRGKLFNVS